MDVLIVGAGLAGLLAAQFLRRRNYSVLVVEKSRGPGGRLATRRLGVGLADLGAQFFTARSEAFKSLVVEWEARGLAYVWSHGWTDSAGDPQTDDHPRYAVHDGMGALAQALTRDLNVQVNVKINSLSQVRDGWQVQDTEGRIFACRAVLLTAPAPQAVTFLETGRTPMQALDLEALRRITYAPCLAGLFQLERPASLPEPGAIQNPSPMITWIADNQRKGLSPEAPLLTVHASGDYSRAHYADRDGDVLAALFAELRPWLNATTALDGRLKRWRYAQAVTTHPERYLAANGVPPLVFAGDGFGEPRVEGAALSGLAAAEQIAGRLA
jgi:predicted NAD/FAD-dependent oxidoreductase